MKLYLFDTKIKLIILFGFNIALVAVLTKVFQVPILLLIICCFTSSVIFAISNITVEICCQGPNVKVDYFLDRIPFSTISDISTKSICVDKSNTFVGYEKVFLDMQGDMQVVLCYVKKENGKGIKNKVNELIAHVHKRKV